LRNSFILTKVRKRCMLDNVGITLPKRLGLSVRAFFVEHNLYTIEHILYTGGAFVYP